MIAFYRIYMYIYNYIYIYCLCHICARLCIVYIVKEAASFRGLGQLMVMARNRMDDEALLIPVLPEISFKSKITKTINIIAYCA